MAVINIAFRILPIPRNLNIKKRITEKERINPLLVLAKAVEKVNSNAINRIKKNKGIIPKLSGSIK